MMDPYTKALDDFEQLLDNAVDNGGGVDAGNGVFIENAHWDHELRDQIAQLRGDHERSKMLARLERLQSFGGKSNET